MAAKAFLSSSVSFLAAPLFCRHNFGRHHLYHCKTHNLYHCVFLVAIITILVSSSLPFITKSSHIEIWRRAIVKEINRENFSGRLQQLVINGERILDEAHLKQLDYEGGDGQYGVDRDDYGDGVSVGLVRSKTNLAISADYTNPPNHPLPASKHPVY